MIPELRTARLVLRAFDPGDIDEIQRLAGDRLIADTTQNIPHPYTREMAKGWVERHEAVFSERTGRTFAIIDRRGGDLIGAVSLIGIEENHQAELGYWIGKEHWGKGYCTEAVHALIQYAVKEFRLIRLYARHLSRNPASGRVLQKVGMVHEGTLRKHAKKWGVFEDLEIYGLVI